MLKISRLILGCFLVGLLSAWAGVGLLRPLWRPREARFISASSAREVAGGHGMLADSSGRILDNELHSDGLSMSDVRTWEGTEVDGGLTTNTQGHLMLESSVRRTFDYFLLATGELPLTTIDTMFKQYVARVLREPAAGEARSLWQRYVQCRDAMAEVGSENGLRERLSMVRALQEHYFSRAEIVALFGADYADDTFAVEHLERLADESVSDEESLERMRSWLDSLPPERRAARDASLSAINR